MNIKYVLAVAATSMALTLVGCKDFSKVEQGRTIAFNKDTKEVTLIHDSAMDPAKPVYDVLPPSVFKLPTDPKETGPEPKAGQRMKLDTEKKKIVIFDTTTQKLVEIATRNTLWYLTKPKRKPKNSLQSTRKKRPSLSIPAVRKCSAPSRYRTTIFLIQPARGTPAMKFA